MSYHASLSTLRNWTNFPPGYLINMHSTLSLAVSIKELYKDRSLALAKQLSLPLCSPTPDENITTNTAGSCSSFDFILQYETYKGDDLPRLVLSDTQNNLGGSISIDFVGGKSGHRRRFGGGRGQPLAKAVGLKGHTNPTVIDATAGLGRDAFVLACLGAHVTLIERSPILAALLADGLDRARLDHEISSVATEHMSLVNADTIEWLDNLPIEQLPDVIYLDPMYPHRSKSAMVKKEMRYLREIVGSDEDASQLLYTALRSARRRVVVKRPRTAPIIGGTLLDNRKPSGTVESKNTRYDIYAIEPRK